MTAWTLRYAAEMHEYYGYDVIVDGDTGFGGVFSNGKFLYMVELI